jgi:DNA-directed RNA polymerase subunit RPC12/RpoP
MSTPQQLPDPYLVAWDKIRRGEKRAMIGMMALVAVMLAGTLFLRYVSLTPTMVRILAIAPILAGSLSLLAYRARFRCPKCDYRILTRAKTSKPGFSQGFCANCGTRVGTPKS